jgi:hypothetical protein
MTSMQEDQVDENIVNEDDDDGDDGAEVDVIEDAEIDANESPTTVVDPEYVSRTTLLRIFVMSSPVLSNTQTC